MPKRSNEFQRLVALLTMLKSEGATVRESVEIDTLDTGKKREVDVVAVGTVAGHRTVVGIEARDTKRKQDVLWVEQAKTKFERLGANVKILVSSSGFTAEALATATNFGIKTITPGQVTPEFVGKIVNNNAVKTQYHHWVTLVQKAEVVITRDGATQRQELPANVPVLFADGSEVSLLETLANHITQQQRLDNEAQLEEMFRKGGELYGAGKVKYVLTGNAPKPTFNGQKVYLRGISPTGEEGLYEIADVVVTYEVKRTVAEVPLTHLEYDGNYFSTGTATLGDDASVQLVWTESPDGDLDVVGRLDGSPESLGLHFPNKTD